MNTQESNLHFRRDSQSNTAFTLIEMLVVIAIIGILAALAVGVGPMVMASKNRSRAKADLAKMQTVIESYKSKVGQYPPDNAGGTNKAVSMLFYELLGTTHGAGPSWTTLDGAHVVTYGTLTNYIGMSGILNATDGANKAKNFFGDLKSSQHASYQAAGVSSPIQVLIGPGEGDPAYRLTNSSGGYINAWNYNSSSPVHNKKSFDLWITIRVGEEKGTNIYETISNW